jgi:hypothetical protein
MKKVVCKILLDQIALVPCADNEIPDSMLRINF